MSSPSNNQPNPLAGGCPVAHNGASAPSSSSSSSSAVNPMQGGCPVARNEPSSSSAARSASSSSSSVLYTQSSPFSELPAHGEFVPPNSIPAAGRGNSDDGKSWLNPSANQLFRALARKDKPIEAKDADSVASVHVAVTDNTWACIMEYEKLHEKSCPNPTLARFTGMDGIFSIKARAMMQLWGMRPFDRHDWYVNRCGKEVKYVIDYYSFETPDPHTGETAVDYFIDARPAPTFLGLVDRATLAFRKWKAGEKFW